MRCDKITAIQEHAKCFRIIPQTFFSKDPHIKQINIVT